ncbi:MAG: hypothetical protein ACJ78V_08655 [Myxococcales bacterium]
MKRISSLLVLGLAACSSSNNSNVALGARAGTGASTAAAPLGQQAQALNTCDGFVITRLRMVLSEVKLESEQTTTADAGSSAGEIEFKSAPSLLDLPQSALDSGTTTQVTVAEVPAGTYHEIKFKIHKISQSEAGSDAGLQAMAAQNASVIVDYTKNGAVPASGPFVSSVDAQQKLEGTFPLTDGDHALTLNIDASTWFGTATSCLDPAIANNRSAIENNIQKSLKAYKDDDHDGHEDH